MSASDIESLQSRTSSGGQSRISGGGRCLHAFLITSVITLFVLLFGVAVFAALYIGQLQTELALKDTGRPAENLPHVNMPKSTFKVQSFTFLRAKSELLKNATMEWRNGSGEALGNGLTVVVGNGFTFNGPQQVLKPLSSGSYLLYLDLALKCAVTACDAVDVTVSVKNGSGTDSLLQCQAVGDSARQGQGRSVKCVSVVRLPAGKRLCAQMEARGHTQHWKLDTEQSGMGMWLVD